jgi:RNA polymerase sigma-70 factor, ECF subfamily
VSRAEVFDRNRPLLFSIAYRMTGSVMDAEDAVQRRPSCAGSGPLKTRCARPRPTSVSTEVADGSIRAIRLVVNPEKLGNVPPLERAEREESSR